MLIIMKPAVSKEAVGNIKEKMIGLGFEVKESNLNNRTTLCLFGNTDGAIPQNLREEEIVDRVVVESSPFRLTAKNTCSEPTVVEVGDCKIGGGNIGIIAGPCAVESEEQLLSTARFVREYGADFLRGGIFKPRTSPYSFQGLGEKGLKILKKAREETKLPIVTEIMDPELLPLAEEYIDVIQIGARNMQNYSLLKKAGQSGLPVILKRGFSATIKEFLLAAEHIMLAGNNRVILCERGIRTFETFTRNTLDLSAVPLIKALSHLPIIVDPSHATGKRDMVEPMARAAIAAGADGLMIEVHCSPEKALCDGDQSLTPQNFKQLMGAVRKLQGL